jgi:transcriptional regulator with XRE-family HTH domain
MPPQAARVPVEAIRREAKLAEEATSLRAVARDIGVSAAGLRQFLNGRSPYPTTLVKLNAWYLRRLASAPEFTAAAAQAGLRVLLEAIPADEREAAAAELLEYLEGLYRGRRLRPPAWLAELRGEG